MSNINTTNPNHRFVARIVETIGKFGKFYKIYINNPDRLNKDGSENKYYKGTLVWYDDQTGRVFEVRGLSIRGVSEDMKKNNTVNSIMLDLGDAYQAKELPRNK